MKTNTFIAMLGWSVFFILIAGTSKSMIIDVDKTGLIIGRISDFTSNQPIEFITVDLYSANDSMLVAGTLTDIDGQFTIAMLDSGNYYIEINPRGFGKKLIQSIIINDSVSKVTLGEILLFPVPRKSSKLFSRAGKQANKVETQIILAEKK